MSIFALVGGGRICELAAAEFPVNSSFTWVDVTTVSPAPEVGWSYAGGTFTAPPAPPAPTLAQQAAAAVSAGLTLTLSGTLTLPATLFPTDATTQGKLADMSAMAARGVLPLGATAYPMKDSAGLWHQFNAAQYQAVAGAIAAYAAALILIADGNPLGVTALPSASVSLTV